MISSTSCILSRSIRKKWQNRTPSRGNCVPDSYRKIPKISPGAYNGGFFCVTSLEGLYLEGLIHGGAYFRNFTVFLKP